MKFKFLSAFMVLPLLWIVGSSTVGAHSSGASLEKNVGDFKIDIGYDPESLTSLTPVSFDFSLQKTSNKDGEFGNIWVMIKKDKKVLFATGIARQKLGATTMVYTFAEKGNYTLSARYESEKGVMAEAEFPLTVQDGGFGTTDSNFATIFTVVAAIVGILVGVVVSWLWKK